MTPEQLAQLRELLRDVRHWRVNIDEALDQVNALVGGVDAPPPDDTGTPLPVPSQSTLQALQTACVNILNLLRGTAGQSQ